MNFSNDFQNSSMLYADEAETFPIDVMIYRGKFNA